jgi:hypothetical protein
MVKNKTCEDIEGVSQRRTSQGVGYGYLPIYRTVTDPVMRWMMGVVLQAIDYNATTYFEISGDNGRMRIAWGG